MFKQLRIVLVCDVVPHNVVAASTEALGVQWVDVPALRRDIKPARIDRNMHACDAYEDGNHVWELKTVFLRLAVESDAVHHSWLWPYNRPQEDGIRPRQ